MASQRVKFEQSQGVESRKVPIKHVVVAGTTTGTADILATVRAGVVLEVKQLTAVNTSASSANLSLHSIDSGGTIGSGNLEISQMAVAGNTAIDLSALIGGLYEQGTTLEVYASTGSVIVVHGWGEEIL